jgi:glycosyltransferase involved in cell wall biosynthesis
MPAPFHICFTFLGDIQYDSRLSRCVKTLSSRGFQVSVLAATEKSERRLFRGANIRSFSVPPGAGGKFRFLLFYLKALWPALRANADCYFASDLYSLPVAYLAAKLRRAKLIYDSRELYSSIAALQDRLHTQRFWSYIESKTIRCTSIVFTVNDALAESISKRYSIAKPTTLLNCPPKRAVQKSDHLRTILPIPPGPKILLYQGGLQQGRGIRIMLSAIRRLSNAVLVLMGNGNLKIEILETIKREGLGMKVFLIDAVPVDDLLEYTASADVGLCLIENYGESYYHSLPNKLFEYVAAGVPVVASNFPEIGRFVELNRVGLCVDPEKEDEIVTAIQRLMTDADLHKTFVHHCEETASRYTWENESLKLVEAIENLLKQ